MSDGFDFEEDGPDVDHSSSQETTARPSARRIVLRGLWHSVKGRARRAAPDAIRLGILVAAIFAAESWWCA